MNILFVNNSVVSPSSSGIQRITDVLVQDFTKQGIQCYSAYYENNLAMPQTPFIDKIRLQANESDHIPLDTFIRKYEIKFVIAQECWPLKRLFHMRQAIKDNTTCQLFYCYHSMPGKELIPPVSSVEYYHFKHDKNKINALKKLLISFPLLSPVFRMLVKQIAHRNYNSIYQLSDKTILLSNAYIPLFQKILKPKHDDPSKFAVIANSLSFTKNLPVEAIKQKQKEVIIVSRLSDRAKRISVALKIWKEIEKVPELQEWKLTIIGTGPDESYYHQLSEQLKLKRVVFEGRQDPYSYYTRAAIYMQTSAYEGFPMALVESLQMGVVPIAFNNYPTIQEIIQNNQDGYICKSTKEYIDKLTSLMRYSDKREQMALNGLQSCLKFSKDKIRHQWLQLFGLL